MHWIQKTAAVSKEISGAAGSISAVSRGCGAGISPSWASALLISLAPRVIFEIATHVQSQSELSDFRGEEFSTSAWGVLTAVDGPGFQFLVVESETLWKGSHGPVRVPEDDWPTGHGMLGAGDLR